MKNFLSQYQLENEIIAVGVSGGADSLALVLRLQEAGKKVVALTVDHGLRPSSAQEADYVAQVMQRFGIEHHILCWDGQKPHSGIEQKAREARYALLQNWCLQNGIKTLAIGHHLRDQAETFLLRLHRGSGLYGLSAMQAVTMRAELRIIRPQLADKPEDLREYLRSRGVQWVEDESNDNTDFLRVKIRKFLPVLAQELGILEERLGQTAEVLAQTRSFVEQETQKILQNDVTFFGKNGAGICLAQFAELHSEMKFRVLGELICQIGERIYIPEAKEMFRLLDEISKPTFKGCTLGNCEIFVAQKKLFIVLQINQKFVLSKEMWQKHLKNVPQYAKSSLPYKLRRAIYLE